MTQNSGNRESPAQFTPGTRVKLLDTGNFGEIAEGPNRKNQYCVVIGPLRLYVDADRLAAAAPRSSKRRKRKAAAQLHPPGESEMSVDLHGLTVEQAMQVVEDAMDRALRSNASRVEFIHGIGSGKLKAAVQRYLDASPHVSRWNFDPTNPGATWAVIG